MRGTRHRERSVTWRILSPLEETISLSDLTKITETEGQGGTQHVCDLPPPTARGHTAHWAETKHTTAPAKVKDL